MKSKRDPLGLYKALGLTPRCSDEAIRTAYRKLAMKFHPDRNVGDDDAAAQYRTVTEAYEVLSDEVRRRTYDETGQADRAGNNDQWRELATVIVPVLTQAVRQAGKSPKHTNLVESMRKMVKNAIKDMEKELDELSKTAAELEDLIGRFSADKDVENLPASILRHDLASLEMTKEGITKSIELHKRVYDYLGKCRFETDKSQKPGPNIKPIIPMDEWSRVNFEAFFRP